MFKCKNSDCAENVHINGAECPFCIGPRIDHAAYTTDRCDKHNKFFTIPGGSCEECKSDFAKAMEGWTPPTKNETEDILDRLFKPVQSARHNTGKVQVREVDPAFIMGLGEVLTASRAKYDEGNWMNETKFSTPYESCMRHLMKFWSGEEIDEETSKHHLLHAATNLMFLYFHQTSGKGIDDRLFKKDKK